MKKIILSAFTVFCCIGSYAQLTEPANGGSAKAMVSEYVGITNVTITYGRPAVKGREGKIWGGLVYAGYQNQGFGSGKDAPWRAGANENTVIEFSTDVLIEGQPLHAGKYGFFVAYGPALCTLIFSSNTSSWGSFFYNDKEDVLKITVKPVALSASQERLSYEFSDETDSSATISLKWEKLAIPFTVATELQQLQLASYERELRGEKGFDPHALVQVADYMEQHNVHLDKALEYASTAAISLPSFPVYMTRARILEKLNKPVQADSIKQMAMEKGSAQEIHNYARQLVSENKAEKAFSVFQYNYKRYPNTYTTNMGMARGYSAMGKPKDALKYAGAALPMAPDEANKRAVEEIIKKLKDGRAI
jgi:tetratricopeptide (TPR) repeat protein